METWLPPWMEKLGAAIGLGLSLVSVVQLIVSGRSAFLDVVMWSGVVGAAVLTLFALVGAIRPSEDVNGKQRLFLAAVAVGLPVATILLAALGDDSWLIILGVVAYFITGILLYVLWDAHRRTRAASVKECPDCLENVKRAARVCRYCGYRWPEEQPEVT
jgi:hypothetical protein